MCKGSRSIKAEKTCQSKKSDFLLCGREGKGGLKSRSDS